MSRKLKLLIGGLIAIVGLPSVTIGVLLAIGWSQLTIFNAVIPHDSASKLLVQNVSYGTNERQSLDVYGPVDSKSTGNSALPVLVFFYGGSWNSGSKEDYAFVGRALAARGFVTVIADYRLVPEVRFPGFVEDGALAVAWVKESIARYGGDRDRLFLAGHSAGAHIAMMLALDGHFLAAQGLRGDTIKGVAGLSGPYDFLPLTRPSSQAAFSHVKILETTQPTHFVTATAPPVFLATGEQDVLVRPRNTRALAQSLNAVGVPLDLHFYSDVDHAGTLLSLSRPLRSTTPVLGQMTDFFLSISKADRRSEISP